MKNWLLSAPQMPPMLNERQLARVNEHGMPIIGIDTVIIHRQRIIMAPGHVQYIVLWYIGSRTKIFAVSGGACFALFSGLRR